MAAATSEVIQEYMTKLGFIVDGVSFKKMTDSLTVVEKTTLKAGAAVASMVAAVEAGVAIYATQMEKMYYASKLSQSSVRSLMSIKQAGEQVGIAGDTMQSAVHGMAQAMRLNPGLQAMVESFGIKVSGRDVSDVMLDFVRALKSMPEYIGAKYAGMFGIDPDTYHLMITQLDTLTTKQKQYYDLYRQYGVDPDKAAETLKNYNNQLRNTETRLNILGMALADKFAPEFTALNGVISDSIDWWIGWAQGTNSASDALSDAAESIEKYALPSFNDLLGKLIGISNLSGKLAAMGNWMDRLFGNKTPFWGPGELPQTPTVPPSSGTPSRSSGSRNERNNNPGNIKYGKFAMTHGATGQDAAGFAIFPSMAVGFKAQQDLLSSYNQHGLSTISSIVSKWAPSGSNDTAAYIRDVAGRMGVGPDQPLDLSNPEIMRRLSIAMARHEGASNAMLASLGTGAGGKNVTLHQQTNINVHGDGADDLARMVAMNQSRVNGDLVRNFGGWVQG